MKKLSLLFLFVLILLKGFAQDPHFLNLNQSLVYLNPSFAGSNGGIRSQTIYRSQWPSLTPYNMIQSSLDAYIKPLNAGIAISASNDNQARGVLKTKTYSLAYAQHFSLKDGRLKIIPSLQLSLMQRNLDETKLFFGGIVDGRYDLRYPNSYTSNYTRRNYDLNSGLLVNYKSFYVGVSVSHLLRPNIGVLSEYNLPVQTNYHTSYNRQLGSKVFMNFSARYTTQSDWSSLQLALNALVMNHVIVGVGYWSGKAPGSTSNSEFVNVGYRNNYFSVQAGYDLIQMYKGAGSVGSWELSLSLYFRHKDQRHILTNFEAW